MYHVDNTCDNVSNIKFSIYTLSEHKLHFHSVYDMFLFFSAMDLVLVKLFDTFNECKINKVNQYNLPFLF